MRDPRVYLVQILERAERIERYVATGEDVFQHDTMTRLRCPEIPWKLMAGFRDVLIHGYDGVDLARVWTAATRDLPLVVPVLRRFLPPLDRLERELAGDDPDPPGG
jgi:uncharacterized protein with HEPN domain